MNIEGIEVIRMDVKLEKTFKGGTYEVKSRPTIVTRVHLKNGIVGETYGGDEFHTQRQIVGVIEDHLTPLVLGRDVRDSIAIWEAMFSAPIDLGNRGLHQLDMHPRGILAQAISAVDNALWDARGKLFRTPLYRLLGGARDKVPVIAIGGYAAAAGEDPIEAVRTEVELILSQEVHGMKLKVGRADLEVDIERVRAARQVGGADFVIAVDANQRWTPAEAIRFCVGLERANLGVRWMEEPVVWYEQTDGLRLLQEKTHIPITAGQGEISGQGCRDLVTKSAINILNADCTLCGGITEWNRIADMARLMSVEMAHHEEPQVAIHLMAAHPHATYVEVFLNRARDPLLWTLPVGFPVIRDGFMEVPQSGGVGVALSSKVIEQNRVSA
jgi:L-alanine-DL-glutamate epimerase-like enolase superfamily enzyme